MEVAMPWFPDFVSAVELARRQTRATGQANPVAQYWPVAGSGPAGRGRRSPRPRTSLPEGSRSTPAVAGSQAAIMQVSVAFATGMTPVLVAVIVGRNCPAEPVGVRNRQGRA